MQGTLKRVATVIGTAAIVSPAMLFCLLGDPFPAQASLFGWGANQYGQIGNGQSDEVVLSAVAIDSFECTHIVDLAATDDSTAASSNARTENVFTWGSNAFKQLGPGGIDPYATQPPATGFTSGATVAAGGFHLLATRVEDGTARLYAWGNSNYGQAGLMGNWGVESPNLIHLPGDPEPEPTAIDGGDIFSMAVGSDKRIYTWGNNVWCQLSWSPRGTHSALPGAVAINQDVAFASAGYAFGIAVGEDYSLWTWGQNTKCQLGSTVYAPIGLRRCLALPADAASVGLPAFSASLHPVAVSAGAEHVLVLLSDGRVFAWGNNSHGELGQGTATSYSCVAVEVTGLPKIVKIAAGGYHNLALDQDGRVWSWGWNASGQLGNNTQIDGYSPVDISSYGALNGVHISEVRAGRNTSFAW